MGFVGNITIGISCEDWSANGGNLQLLLQHRSIIVRYDSALSPASQIFCNFCW